MVSAIHRKTVRSFARCLSGMRAPLTNIGGLSRGFFMFNAEEATAFVNSVLFLRITHVSPGSLSMSMPLKSALVGEEIAEHIHHGVVAAAIDHTAGLCSWTTVDKPEFILSTINLRIDYLSNLTLSDEGLALDATVVHAGNRLVRTDVVCWNQSRTRKIALGRSLFNVYPHKSDRVWAVAMLNSLFRWSSNLGGTFLLGLRALLMSQHHALYILRRGRAGEIIRQEVTESQDMYGGMTFVDYRKYVEQGTSFCRHILSVRLSSVSRGQLVLSMPFRPVFTGNFSTPCLHGGVTAALMNHCATCCAKTVVDDNFKFIDTIDFRIDYLYPAPCFEDILCTGTVISCAKSMIRVNVECWNHNKTLKVASGRVLLESVDRINI